MFCFKTERNSLKEEMDNSQESLPPIQVSTGNTTPSMSNLGPVSSILSPTQRLIDSGLVLYETHTSTDPQGDVMDEDDFNTRRDQASIEDFLSSLELQVRDPTEPAKEKSSEDAKAQFSGETFEDRIKTLKIANILNDLDFSSDSDGLPSDLDELLDYANADEDEYYRVPRSGGKWGPSGKLSGKYMYKKTWPPGQ